MADRNPLKITDPVDIAEDDPFAELTRIMGFDPRQKVVPQSPTKLGPLVEPGAQAAAARPVAAAAESTESEFDIDLEKELLGELDVELEPEAPVAAERVSAPEPVAVEPEPVFAQPEPAAARAAPTPVAPEPQAAAPVDAAVNELDFELAEGFDDAFAASVATDFEDSLAADLAVDIEDEEIPAIEAELSAMSEPEPELEPVAAPVEPEAVAEPEPVMAQVERAPEPVDLFADDFDAAMADVDMDFTSDPIAPAAVAEEDAETEDEPVVVEAVAETEDDVVLDDAVFADDFHIDLEEELGSFEPETIEVEAETVEVEAETVEQAAPEEVEADVEEFEPVAAAPEPVAEVPAFERFDVDAELERLLRRGAEPVHRAPAVEAEPEPAEAAADEFSLGFDEQELLAATEEAARAQAADHEATDDYDEVDDQLDIRLADETEEGEIQLDLDDAEDGDVPDFDHDDFEAALARGLSSAVPVGAAALSAGRAASEDHSMQFSAPPVSKRDPLDEIAELTEKYSAPLPKTFSRANPVAARPQMSARLFRDEPAVRQDFARTPFAAPASGYRQANYDDIPEIETVEVADRPIAIEDDLDIPDLSFDDDVPPVADYDDLDAEFASLLTDLNGPAPAPQRADPPVAKMPAADPFELDASYRAGAQAAAPQAEDDGDYDTPPLAGSYDFDMDDLPGSRSPSTNYAADDYDLGSDLDDGLPSAGASSAAMAEGRSSSPRRGMLIAAIVGGVALVGGVGAFALSFGGSGDDVPVIVKADDQPIKVKPANPGGTTVPNQDNKVYDTVAGADATAAPQQEKLVTTTEEPIDVTPQEEPDAEAALADGGPALDEGTDIEASSEEAPQGKGEDRISQIVEENAGDSDAEIAAVAPRKVRTLVVKPDGTLMPREEPVAEAAPVEAAVPAAAEPQADAPVEQEMAAAPIEEMTQPVTEDAAPAYTPPAAEKPVQVKKRQAAKTAPAPAAEETVASAEPAPALAPVQTSGEITSAMPEVVPIAPQRPAEQPVDVVGEVKPDQVAAVSGASTRNGSWAMQIASQPSEAAAQSSYQDLARRYGGVLAGHEVNIVKAEIAGKGTFWRVRVPAGSRNEAVSLCENYKAAGGNCFVSR